VRGLLVPRNVKVGQGREGQKGYWPNRMKPPRRPSFRSILKMRTRTPLGQGRRERVRIRPRQLIAPFHLSHF